MVLFRYGETVQSCKKTTFAKIFISFHHQWQVMTRKEQRNREYEKEEEDKTEREKKKLNHGSGLNNPMKGAPLPYCIEDRVPYVCLHIGAHIFIETFPRAGIVAGGFECFRVHSIKKL